MNDLSIAHLTPHMLSNIDDVDVSDSIEGRLEVLKMDRQRAYLGHCCKLLLSEQTVVLHTDGADCSREARSSFQIIHRCNID